MSDSIFNAEQFLQTSTDKVGQTTYAQVPEGDHSPAQITKVGAHKFLSQKTNQEYTVLDLEWTITSPEALAATNMDAPKAPQSIFLDMTLEGSLDFGVNKNIGLSRLRDAVGQLREGRPWNPNMLLGATAVVHVKHRQDDNGDARAQVDRVAKG